MTAIWVLADDAVPNVTTGSIAVSVSHESGTEADGTLQVVYADADSNLAECRIEIGNDLIERNPPVFSTLCGLG